MFLNIFRVNTDYFFIHYDRDGLKYGIGLDDANDMESNQTYRNINHFLPLHNIDQDQMQAGTGFMMCLSDAIRNLQKKGYTENLVAEYDHFRINTEMIYPPDFFVDQIVRFENSSDPDDQSILYAVNSERYGLKGLYVDSYGLYHESLSKSMLERIQFCQKQIKEIYVDNNP